MYFKVLYHMNANIDDLRYIRSTMERSGKFLSLSGMSGVIAGLLALAGAAVAYQVVYQGYTFTGNTLADMILIAGIVLVGAVSFGVYFSFRKAKKTGAKFWMPVTLQLLKDAGVPLAVGGVFSILLIYHNTSFLVASAMLVFYGLALISAGARTYRDIKILGVCEVVIGILAGIFTQYGLFLWALGFGVMHILYGIVLYKKYDSEPDKND